MNDIKAEFQSKYSESLKSFIDGDTSGKNNLLSLSHKLRFPYFLGNYKKALLALCGEIID